MGSASAAAGWALGSAVAWGAGDFAAGLAARRASVFAVTFAAHVIGLALILAVALAAGEPLPSAGTAAWSGAAGASGVVGALALYAALARGRMGVAAPLVALVNALLPVLVAIALEGPPAPVRAAGFLVGLAGVFLLARPPGAQAAAPAILGLALVSGMGFGGMFVLLDQAGEGGTWWPLVLARVASLAMLAAVLLARREARALPRTAWRATLLVGLTDPVGNAAFLLATQAGRLDVASVIASLYPAATVLLARVVLKERLAPWQVAGVALALVAIALVAW